MKNSVAAATGPAPFGLIVGSSDAKQVSPQQEFWQDFVKTKGVRVQPLGSSRIAVHIDRAAERFNLDQLFNDCFLKANAERCPGSSGTVDHFLEAGGTLQLSTYFRDDLIRLLYRHRRDTPTAA